MADLEERFSDWDEPMEVPFAGYEKRFEPIHALDNPQAKNLTSILLLIGSNDILYSPSNMEDLRKKQKKLVANVLVVENPDRKDNFKLDKAAYFQRIKEFMGN